MQAIKNFALLILLCYVNTASGQTGNCYTGFGWGGTPFRATAEAALTAAWQAHITYPQTFDFGPLEIDDSGTLDRWLLARISRTTPPVISGPPVVDGIYLTYPSTMFLEIWDSRTEMPAGERSWAGPYVRCSPALTVALTGSNETRPAGTGGTSEVTLTAKVTSGGTPKSGAALTFSVDVIANSGGHEHDVARPKGTLSSSQGLTDINGEIKFIFKAPEIAGIHTIKATCAACSNSPAVKEVQVKVPDLLPISPNPPQNADGSYTYALTSVDKIHEGTGRYHKSQYWLTEQSLKNLASLIQAFGAQGWGTVALNDASMYWGGRYDISGNWVGPHQGHREGREIDISFARANNPISAAKQSDFYDKFCKEKAAEAAFSILHHFVKAPHFHVYLDKQKSCNRTEK